MKIYDVQVNHLMNPVGFRMERVSLSWKVKESRDKRQKSARVVVALDENMTNVILDTGFDTDADSLCYEIPVTLRPRTRYYYTVSVRTDAGEEGVSEVYFFETGKREEPWQARWITCDSIEPRHPYFEKEIIPKQKVERARLYISGLGLYEAYFAGNRIGEEFFAPYSNDYNRWIQYQTYDVTEQLHERGKLSILLGNGWYKARFGFTAHEDKGFYGNEWKLIAELRLTYEDGTEDVIGTDETWQVRRSTITFSNLYDGEHRDDTLPDLPVVAAQLCGAPKGKLTDRMSTPVIPRETFVPKALIHTPKNELVLDMGQNFTGIFELEVDVPKGQLVRIQTGEIMQEGCFYNENLRTAKSEYLYISGGEPIILQPHFTYYGYRYVKIEGIPNLTVDDFTGIALYSEIPLRGTMHTGHDLVNQLLSNIRWGMKGNFLDVPTDCPQRDERMGWTGDTQVFSPTATYLHDTYSFYAKYLYDMYQEQMDLGGMVPDVIPSCGVETCACVWGDAACIIPWNLYQFYGDLNILKDQFSSMKAWVDYISGYDGEDHAWRSHFHYGDWLALDNMNGNPEETYGATDEGFIANLYYAASSGIVAKSAELLGYWEEKEKYEHLCNRQMDIIRKEYYSSTGRPCFDTQTALVLTLKYGLSSNEELVKQLLKKRFHKSGGKLQTGFAGTPLLCNVLTEHGMVDQAWELLLNEEYPGWLREVKLGATTVWERWNSVLDDGSISGTSMNSLNHYAYGSIAEWMFRHVAGLNVSHLYPGCRHMDIRPNLNWKLREQDTVYDSPCGEYRSSWKIVDTNHVQVHITVPFGASATLVLPDAEEEKVYMLDAGAYNFTYRTRKCLRPEYSMSSTIRELKKDPAVWEAANNVLPICSAPQQYWDIPFNEMLEKVGNIWGNDSREKAERFFAQMVCQ